MCGCLSMLCTPHGRIWFTFTCSQKKLICSQNKQVSKPRGLLTCLRPNYFFSLHANVNQIRLYVNGISLGISSAPVRAWMAGVSFLSKWSGHCGNGAPMYFSFLPVGCGQEYVPPPIGYEQVQVLLPTAEEWCIIKPCLPELGWEEFHSFSSSISSSMTEFTRCHTLRNAWWWHVKSVALEIQGGIVMDNSPQYVWRRVFSQILKWPYLSRFLSDRGEIKNLNSFYQCEELRIILFSYGGHLGFLKIAIY